MPDFGDRIRASCVTMRAELDSSPRSTSGFASPGIQRAAVMGGGFVRFDEKVSHGGSQ